MVEPEAAAVGAGGDSGVALKELTEKRCVLVADGVANFPHGTMIAFQQSLGRGYAKFLYVDQRAVSGGLLKAANEIAQAHADVACQSFQRKILMKILVQPLLRVGDGGVGMLRF